MLRSKGFTLIELMIVVAIVGILVAIAYPSYQGYLQDARRADAQADLLELAQWMERQFTVNGVYTVSGGSPTLPFIESPKDGNNKYYDLSVSTTAAAFSLSAAPKGAQSTDGCGTLSVDQTGDTTVSGSGDECW